MGINIPKPFIEHKIEIQIFIAGTMVSLLFFFIAYTWGTIPSLPVISGGEDVEQYAVLAQNMLDGKGFTLSDTEPYEPESFRLPGYPVFIAILLSVFGSMFAVPVVQSFIFGGIALLIFVLARDWFDEKTAYFAATLSLLNTSLLFHTSILVSDPLFILLLLLGLRLWLYAHDTVSPHYISAGLSGFLIGLATLTRTIGFLLPVIFISLSVVLVSTKAAELRVVPRKILGIWILFLTLSSVTIAPWLIRNYMIYNQFSLSSTGTIGMWYYNIPQAIADNRNISVEEARRQFVPPGLVDGLVGEGKYFYPLRQLDATPVLKEEIRKYLDDHLGEYVKSHLLRSSVLLIVDSTRDTSFLMGIPITEHNIAPAEVTGAIKQGNFMVLGSIVQQYIQKNMWGNILALLSFGFWMLMAVMVFVGTVFALKFIPRERAYIGILCCLGMILYFTLLTGPVALPRYRLPLEPFVFMLGGYGLIQFFYWVRSRLGHI
jgi:4-amino-4-deoxy-L-arabinose transferase-like glycosyltransferase